MINQCLKLLTNTSVSSIIFAALLSFSTPSNPPNSDIYSPCRSNDYTQSCQKIDGSDLTVAPHP